jgi:hypothetical protein
MGEELLRVDPAHHVLGLRLNFYVATLLCLAGLAWFRRIQRAPSRARKPVEASPPGPAPRGRPSAAAAGEVSRAGP